MQRSVQDEMKELGGHYVVRDEMTDMILGTLEAAIKPMATLVSQQLNDMDLKIRQAVQHEHG